MYKGEIGKQVERLQDLGVKQGRQNLPPQGATSLDANETKLEATAKKFVLDELSGYKKLIAGLDSTVDASSHSLREVEAKCEALLSDSSGGDDISHHLSGEVYSLVKLKVNELAHLSDFLGYRAEHDISRQAHYPKDFLYHFSLIFIAVAIETIVNAFFFENANGLVGGAVVAFAVSIVNLGTAAFFGYFFRYKNHKEGFQKFVGWTCLFLAVLTSIYLNAVFSTFRAEYANVLDPNSVTENSAAFKNSLSAAALMFNGYIPFADILSFVLFFVGLLLSAFAFYKGYTTDDSYPGYGQKDRLYKISLGNLEVAQAEAHAKLRTFLDARRTELASVKSSLATENQRITQTRNTLATTNHAFSAVLQQIQMEYKLAMESYRMSNKAVRTVPAPGYFVEIADITSEAAKHRDGGTERKLDELTESFNEVRGNYIDRISQRIQDLAAGATQTLGAGFQQFMTHIQSEAFAQIQSRASHGVKQNPVQQSAVQQNTGTP